MSYIGISSLRRVSSWQEQTHNSQSNLLKILVFSFLINAIPLVFTWWLIASLWYFYHAIFVLVGWISLSMAVLGFAQSSRGMTNSAIGIYVLGSFICFCLMFPIGLGLRLNITPLHFAVLTGQPLIVQGFLLAGSDINAQDFGGNTPLDYAINWKKTNTVETLIRAGASKKPDIQ